MTISRNATFALLLAVGLGAGFWLGASPSSPVNPNPPQPIKRALGYAIRAAARIGLWVALAAEEPPSQKPETDDRQQLVNAPRHDVEGHPRVNHREGW